MKKNQFIKFEKGLTSNDIITIIAVIYSVKLS